MRNSEQDPSDRSGSGHLIAVFDSGFGGLTVLRELQKALPLEQFVYLGDTARTPYGPRGRETILRYSQECARFLLARHDIKLLVVACNTASAIAIEALESMAPCPVIGTIDQAAASAANRTRSGRIGVIGTEATVASEVYQQALRKYNPDSHVVAKACPLFVPLVEQGMFKGVIVDKVVEYYLSELRDQQIDTLILGCTHYPLLKSAISNYLKESVEIVECSTAVAAHAKLQLQELQLIRSTALPGSENKFFVTDGVAQFNKMAATFLQAETVSATKIDISEAVNR